MSPTTFSPSQQHPLLSTLLEQALRLASGGSESPSRAVPVSLERWSERVLARSPFRRFAAWSPADRMPLRSRHFSREEIGRLLDGLERGSGTWEGGRLFAVAATWAYAGLRRDEALRLTLDRLDCDQGVLWIEPPAEGRLKTAASAAPVPMPAVLKAILSSWHMRCDSAWLFPGRRGRSPWVGGAAGKRAADQLRAAGEAVGLFGLTPHSLRHSLATHLTSTWSLTERQVQLILRHTSTRTQRRYVHPELRDLVRLVRDVRYGA
jgi:integrase